MSSVQPTAGDPGPTPFRLAHISDPHLTSLHRVHWRELLNKRLLGYASWRLRRRAVHRPEILNALQRALVECRPDHIAVTGDLTHLGTPAECLEARQWLEQLGPPAYITVIPGNHDRYAPSEWSETLALWLPYMQGDDPPGPEYGRFPFPTLRKRGPVALVGLSTARPTAPFLATGKVGYAQLEQLERLLDSTAAEDLFRIVLMHHSPLAAGVSRRRRLDDTARLVSVLKQHGTELVLHGHGHRPVTGALQTDTSVIPVFGVPSASSSDPSPEKRAGYNIYEIAASNMGWTLRVLEQRWDPARACFVPHAQHSLLIPAPRASPHNERHAAAGAG
ncbi:MAG: metallophosphoesterase [Gammaproteobacteria bacterium]|nr:metallophosphoesterase [Gammaproteobacteria bacterium]